MCGLLLHETEKVQVVWSVNGLVVPRAAITLTAHTGTAKLKVMQHLAACNCLSLQPSLRKPLLQKLTVVQLTKKFIVFNETL